METKTNTLEKTLVYGLITGAGISGYLLILFASGLISWGNLYTVKLIFSLEYLILLAGMIWAGIEIRRREAETGITYGRAFLVTFLPGVWAGLVSSLFIFVWADVIQPDLQEILIGRIKEAMVSIHPALSDKGYCDILHFATRFTSPAMEFSMSLIYYIKVCAFFALIIAFFLRTKKARFYRQSEN